MHFIFLFLALTIPSFSMTTQHERGRSPFDYGLTLNIQTGVVSDGDDSGCESLPSPLSASSSSKKAYMPQQQFKDLIDRINTGQITIEDAAKESGCTKESLTKASKNRRKREGQRERVFQEALISINNNKTTINQVHKTLHFPVDKIKKGLVEKFGSKRLQIKKAFIENSKTSFKEDVRAIDNPESPVCIAWVIEKHKVEPKKVTAALKNLSQSKREQKREKAAKSFNGERNLGILALKELKSGTLKHR